jgi:hypothetical protein
MKKKVSTVIKDGLSVNNRESGESRDEPEVR